MTSDDEMPWSAPWTERREPHDEASFVADVSGALYVPDAAPEIRMIAEVMAALDIPSTPERGLTVAQLLEQERGAAAGVVPFGRFVLGRRLAGVAAAAVVALGLLTASAFAGVLPDSIQKVAHSVIDAPAPDGHSEQPSAPSDRSGNPADGRTAGDTGNGGSGGTTGTGAPSSGAAPSDSAVPHGSSPAPSDAVSPPSSDATSGPPSAAPTGSGANNGGNGKGHKTKAPAAGQNAAAPSGTRDPVGPTPTR